MKQIVAPKVFIVILNWYRVSDILECLESVYYMDYGNYSVVVVDNGTDDDSSKIILNKYPKVKLIRSNCNLGFSGGNNLGIRYSINNGANYVWLLNNDTLLEPDCLTKLVEEAEKNDLTGLVSPVVYYYENPEKWQFAGSYINMKDLSLRYPVNGCSDLHAFQRGNNICLWGTALLIKRKVIERIGMLKEEFFAYWEDTEYSIRAIRAGFKNVVCQSAKVYHKGQPETMEEEVKGEHFYYFMERNRCLLANEYFNTGIKILKFRIRYLGELSDHTRRYPKVYLEATLNGAWQGLKGVKGPMKMDIKMPVYLRWILLYLSKYHPVFIGNLFTGNFKEIWHKIILRWSIK